MAEEDTLFGLDVVKDFILSKGGKTTNHELVTHFKSFLNNPKWKNQNRQKFKEIVNMLATVKLDESGEKVLVLKRKYRDGAPSNQSADTCSSLLKELPKHRPKAKKAKLAEQFESAMSSEMSSADLTLSSRDEKTSLLQSDVHVGPSLSEMIAGEIGNILTSEQQPDDGTCSASGHESDQKVPGPEQEKRVTEHVPLLMVEEDISPEEPPVSGVTDGKSPDDDQERQDDNEESHTQGQVEAEVGWIASEGEDPHHGSDDEEARSSDGGGAAAAAADIGVAHQDVDTDSGICDASAVDAATDTDGSSTISSCADSMASAQAPSKQTSEAILEESSVSVRARAQHLNKIESLSSLQSAVPGTQKPEHTAKVIGAADDEDSNSESSMTVTLTDVERKWMVDASKCDYHELAKALNTSPKLARYKDFILGYTALHWAAKQGNSDVIKLLCGSKEGVDVNAQTHGGYTALHLASIQGHEDIIELLVQGYKADPDVRDHSGRKAKQYLKHSASTRSQQLLQPGRIHTNIATGTNQTTFRRMGSYSSKIRTMGETPFGIQGGAAMRKSWAAPASVITTRSATPSPGQSPRQSPGSLRRIKSDKDQQVMPPPQALPVRRQTVCRAVSRENLSDSELPSASLPKRTTSDSNLIIQTETGV